MRDKTNHLELLKSRMNEEFDSADQLADWIGEIFECPITIEDSNHHVVSYSKHKENIDEARIGTIMNRKVPDNVINGLWKKGVMSKLIDQDEAVVIPQINEIGLGNRVAISIREKNEILGFIWAHTGNKNWVKMNSNYCRKSLSKFVNYSSSTRNGIENQKKVIMTSFGNYLLDKLRTPIN